MEGCKFTNELNKLRKSSSESIDNVAEFSDFKRYMHVVRDAEIDLKTILRLVNDTGKKTLILLCGSAGDGKSHLLSYLKNSDDEELLKGYIVYNDATESNAPNKTAIETLREVLDGFTDENIIKEGKSIILAINLGVLSNFIESEYGKDYIQLHNYVKENHILTSKVNRKKIDMNSSFQHVSFSDYHMYLLENGEITPKYIEDIFEKIVYQSDENTFFSTYKEECTQCPLNCKCPVKHNYEYFMNPIVRNFISEMLVKVVIMDKEILTTRELLNYIYDILVSQEFNYIKLQKSSVNMSKFLKEYISCITPIIIYKNVDVSVLMNNTRKFDPLLERNEEADTAAIEYYVSEDVSDLLKKMLTNTPYADVLTNNNSLDVINNDKVLKSILFNIIVRVNKMTNEEDKKSVYEKFVKDLYFYNSGKIAKLSNLYSDIEEAVRNWCGNEPGVGVCIDDNLNGLSIYEDVEFEEYIGDEYISENEESLKKFIPYIIVKYSNAEGNPISLDVDYSLYELIKKLKRGYIQTAEDRNNHADFISFVSKILKSGTADKKLTIISDEGRKAIIEKKFGKYKFKVVK